MSKTPIPLYRQGNAISPKMDNVRPARSLENNYSQIEDSSSSNLQISAQELMQPVLQLPIHQRLVLVNAITESIRQELLLTK